MAGLKQIPNVLGAANSGRLPGDELGRSFQCSQKRCAE